MDSGQITVNGAVYPIKRATFDLAAGANADAVAAVTGKKIRVIGLAASGGTTAAGTTITLRSATTAKTPALIMVFGTNLVYPFGPNIAETVAGEALNVLVGAGALASGILWYVETD